MILLFRLPRRRIVNGLIVLLMAALFFIQGCGPKQTPLDDKVQVWSEMAEQARGYTPTALPREAVQEVYEEPVSILEDVVIPAERPLPTRIVNLNMQNTSVDAILMLMARVVDVNLVLSPGVHGISGVSFRFQNVPWDNAFRGLLRSHGLTYFWEGDVLQVYSLKDIEHDINVMERLQRHRALTTETGRLEPLVTSIVKLRYISPGKGGAGSLGARQPGLGREAASSRQPGTGEMASGITDRLLPFLSMDEDGYRRGAIHYEPDTNSLILHATRTDTNKIIRVLEHIDRPRPQVHIQAHIVETTKDTARDLGIQWGGRRAGVSDGQPWMLAPGVGGTTTEPVPVFNTGQGGAGMAGSFPADLSALGGLSLGFLMGGANYLEAQLSALQTDRKANILSSPSITTLDNLTAFTETGERVPYVSMDEAGNPQVNWEDAVLRLEITPNVIDASQLRMSILVKKDHVDDVRTVMGNPYIIKKETQTSLVARSGETIVISGLTEELSSNRQEGVPWLKDIPGLGALFRRDRSGQELSEVLIFITPTILPERVTAAP